MKYTVYFLSNGEEIKIGFSSQFKARLAYHRSTNVKIEVLGTIPGDRAKEREMHDRFAAYRLHGEWFADTEYMRGEIAKIIAEPHDSPSQPDLDLMGKIFRKVFADSCPGERLAEVASIEMRAAYRYVYEQQRVPGIIAVKVLRNSHHGEQFLRAMMDGCDQPWWLELERELDANAMARAGGQ